MKQNSKTVSAKISFLRTTFVTLFKNTTKRLKSKNGGKGYHINPETKTFYVTPQEESTYVTPTFEKFESIKKMIDRLNSDKPIDDTEVFKKEIWSPFELEKITNEQVQKVVVAFNTKTV